MIIVGWDTETSLIRPACLAPPLVCLTWQTPGQVAQIAHVSTSEPILRAWLEDPTVCLVGHNVAYDMAVVCERFPALRGLVFAAYAADRVTDTLIRQQLLDVAGGCYRGRVGEKGQWFSYEYTLEALAERNAKMVLLKDGWRLSYGSFLDVPLEDWPARARDVQAEARPRMAELEAAHAYALEQKDDARAKGLKKELDGLREMVAGDPNRASEYPLDDARATLAVYLAQEKHAAYLKDQFRQARAAWALHLVSCWGIRTDEVGVEGLRAATQAAYDELEDDLIQLGLIRDDPKASRDTNAAKLRMIQACAAEGLPLRRTKAHADRPEASKWLDGNGQPTKCRDVDDHPVPSGCDTCAEHVCLDAEACAATDDEVLHDYAAISTLKKVLSNDVEALLKGILYPVHTRFGFAETGRTTSSKPNIQNVRRLEGVRECFVPRPGMVFFAADFPALELYAWAQCCMSWLGYSKMAEALNAGRDPHLIAAAVILKCSYENALDRYTEGDVETDDIRQLSKVGNFGWPGGMGPATMLRSVKKQLKPAVVERLGLDLARMEQNRDEWRETWPEAKGHFDRVKSLGPPYPAKYRANVESLFTGRHRGNASYCSAANNGFQALGVDCAKEALWRVVREQYDVPSSALYNTRSVNFVHDEIIGEALEAVAADAAARLADVMVEGANIYLPDVKIVRAKVKPVLMRRWSKKAKPVFDATGRLVPWES